MFRFGAEKKNSTTTSTKKSTKQADAFSLPDDENENNDDDSEFVYEKITLLTADGVVVLPGRKLRRSSLEGGSPSVRARWRREAEERRRRRRAAEAKGAEAAEVEADVARACDLPQKRRTTGHEIEAKYRVTFTPF